MHSCSQLPLTELLSTLLRVLYPSCYYKLPGQLRGLTASKCYYPIWACCAPDLEAVRAVQSLTHEKALSQHKHFRAHGDNNPIRGTADNMKRKGWGLIRKDLKWAWQGR